MTTPMLPDRRPLVKLIRKGAAPVDLPLSPTKPSPDDIFLVRTTARKVENGGERIVGWCLVDDLCRLAEKPRAVLNKLCSLIFGREAVADGRLLARDDGTRHHETLIFDCDDELKAKACRDLLDDEGVAYLAYTSVISGPGGLSWRYIVPLITAIDQATHRDLKDIFKNSATIPAHSRYLLPAKVPAHRLCLVLAGRTTARRGSDHPGLWRATLSNASTPRRKSQPIRVAATDPRDLPADGRLGSTISGLAGATCAGPDASRLLRQADRPWRQDHADLRPGRSSAW